MPRPTQFADRDLNVQLRFPTLSWSSMNAYLEYDQNKWYDQYVLGIRSAPNGVMQGGIDVGERIVSDPTYLPVIERPEIYEQNFVCVLGDIKITGHLDGWSPKVPAIDEYKTSSNPNRWTQNAVDDWGQLTFYCLLVYIHKKIKPETIRLRLYSIPMIGRGDFTVEQKGMPQMFTTKRTMSDILKFAALIRNTHASMRKFIDKKSKK